VLVRYSAVAIAALVLVIGMVAEAFGVTDGQVTLNITWSVASQTSTATVTRRTSTVNFNAGSCGYHKFFKNYSLEASTSASPGCHSPGQSSTASYTYSDMVPLGTRYSASWFRTSGIAIAGNPECQVGYTC
jgi:hypothetical protein